MNLRITQFGSDLLRQKATELRVDRITSAQTQGLIVGMQELLRQKKLGIGLAAPQVGVSLALALVELQRTKLRDMVEDVSLVLINPKIVQVFGRKTQLWEGCISSGAGKAALFAKVPRYKKIELEYLDENAVKHKKVFEGLSAHVIQHEVDHLNGIIFVDKVVDTKTFMTITEYKKMKKKTKTTEK